MEPKRTSEFSLTNRGQVGETTSAILNLGRLLEADLERTDTLGRWMAHYLAQQMTILEQKHGQERAAIESDISELVLQVWDRRCNFLGERAPFLDIDKVVGALERLAPGRDRWGYYNIFDSSSEPSVQDTDVNFLLKSALRIDRIAGDLVHALVSRAAKSAENNDANWIKNLDKIGDDSLSMIRRLYSSLEGDGGESFVDDVRYVKKYVVEMSDTLSLLANFLE